jgi:RimJ/RimL family protein N-acetyltransferase
MPGSLRVDAVSGAALTGKHPLAVSVFMAHKLVIAQDVPCYGVCVQQSDYFLTTERLGFRWWRHEDFGLARQLWGDPQVTRLFSKSPWTDEQVRDRLNTEIQLAASYGVQYWPVFELATSDHLGCCGLRPYRPSEKIYELGFHLRPACWGKGFATEAARAALTYALQTLGASAVFAGHHPANASSRRVLQKLGFKHTGCELYEPTGLEHPSYMFTREDWRSQEASPQASH